MRLAALGWLSLFIFFIHFSAQNSSGQASDFFVEQAVQFYGIELNEPVERSIVSRSGFPVADSGIFVGRTFNAQGNIALWESANQISLTGQWIVKSADKNGDFSEAQIGQEPGDIISIEVEGTRIQVT